MQTMELVENIVNYVPISTENETTEIVIDMSEAKYKFPDGTGEIWWHRADGEVYLLESVTEENGLLKATLTDVDLEPSGLAEVEGWWLDGTRLKKSPTYKIGIHQSFTTAAAIKAAKDRELDLLAQVEELKQAYEETYDAINQARASAQAAQAAERKDLAAMFMAISRGFRFSSRTRRSAAAAAPGSARRRWTGRSRGWWPWPRAR